MSWIKPSELHSQQSITNQDMFYAASIIQAYTALLEMTQKKRNEICKEVMDAE